ncbi:MAG: hypothetical protein M3347_06515, partial [Armatimonadota bacterium]|nr:hypothetical protein [Armatimonadota bacterium]
MRRIIFTVNCLLLLTATASAAEPIFRVVRSADASVNLLRNGGFEEMQGEQPAGWSAWKSGFRMAAGEGRGGSRAVVCENASGKEEHGVGQTLTLNRTAVAPLIVRGWSKAQDVSRGADPGYSIYVDLVYNDGTPLWGQTANFHCGTHDWQQRELLILPEKPVKSLSVYCLLRGHTGKAWFDDVAVEESKVEGGAVVFQGAPVRFAP